MPLWVQDTWGRKKQWCVPGDSAKLTADVAAEVCVQQDHTRASMVPDIFHVEIGTRKTHTTKKTSPATQP